MIHELAAEGHGVVARRELLDAGLSAQMVNHRVAAQRLILLHPGVYAVGHRSLRREGVWRAAVLAGGPGAVLSHRDAAAAWELRSDRRARVDITVQGARGRRSPTLDAHRCRLDPQDTTELRGIPITTPARTLLDLAEVVPARHLDRALEAAIQLDLYDGFALADVLARATGRRGLKRLRQALATLHPDAALAHSELERLMLELVIDHGLPRPSVNVPLAGFEVDLLWRDHRLVVELDGYRFHKSRDAFERDRRRDARLQALGYRVLRFTWRQLTTDPGFVVTCVSSMLRA